MRRSYQVYEKLNKPTGWNFAVDVGPKRKKQQRGRAGGGQATAAAVQARAAAKRTTTALDGQLERKVRHDRRRSGRRTKAEQGGKEESEKPQAMGCPVMSFDFTKEGESGGRCPFSGATSGNGKASKGGGCPMAGMMGESGGDPNDPVEKLVHETFNSLTEMHKEMARAEAAERAEARTRQTISAFCAMWCAIRIWETYWSPSSTLRGMTVDVLMVGFSCAAALPTADNRLPLVVSLAFSMYRTWTRIPGSWDNEYWDFQTDLGLLVLAFGGRHGWLDEAAALIRSQYALFYFAAGFWKLNAGFFDPTASCGTLFLLQHLGRFVGYESSLVHIAAKAAPGLTVALELATGAAMYLRPKLGAGFGILLHALISATPRPNNISSFSAKCVARLLFFADLDVVADVWDNYGRKTVAQIVPGLFAVAYALSPSMTPQDFATLIFVPGACLVSVCLLGKPQQRRSGPKLDSDTANTSSPRTKKNNNNASVFTRLLRLVAFVYAFGLIPLGLQDLGAPSMYANLLFTGGSNHFLAPTALLHHAYANDPKSVFYGGVVRVDDTNSTWIRRLYPGDRTSTLEPPNLTQLMTTAGYVPPVMYHPALGRVLGRRVLLDDQHWRPFTFPAFEFRRLLAETRAAENDPFFITYSRLPGTSGDQVWRATAGATFTAHFHRGWLRGCGPLASDPCDDDLLALPPLPWLATKLMLFLPYPILVRDPQADIASPLRYPPNIQCFGP